jgi:hypothetical protein
LHEAEVREGVVNAGDDADDNLVWAMEEEELKDDEFPKIATLKVVDSCCVYVVHV